MNVLEDCCNLSAARVSLSLGGYLCLILVRSSWSGSGACGGESLHDCDRTGVDEFTFGDASSNWTGIQVRSLTYMRGSHSCYDLLFEVRGLESANIILSLNMRIVLYWIVAENARAVAVR